MRAGIYVRISRDIAGKGLGVQRQEEDCRDLAKQLGWEVAEVYADNDVSATSGKRRPRYEDMLRDIQSGDIGAIVTWHADRLYRQLRDLMPLIDIMKAVNAQIATCQSGDIDLSSPTGRMIASIMASVNTQEVEHKAERWARSWQQGRENGAPITNSNRLFGYERDGCTIVEDEAAITREMIERVRRGSSHAALLRWLHEMKVPTTRGNMWRTAALKSYLLNPRIAGYSTHKGEIVGEGTWPALVDREKWEEVRALLSGRTREHVPRKALLLGMAYCGLCGSRMITGYSRGRTYRCPSRPDYDGCGRMSIFAAPIEEMVESYARTRLDDPAVRQRIGELRAHPTGAQNELASLDTRIVELEQQLDEPGVPVAALLRAIERAKARQEELLGELAAARVVPLPRQGGPWPEDLRRRRDLIELVVERVDVVNAKRLQKGINPERVKITPR